MSNKYTSLIISAVLMVSPVAGVHAASLINLGYGSSSQNGVAAAAEADADAHVKVGNMGVIRATRADIPEQVSVGLEANDNRQNPGLPNSVVTDADLKTFALGSIQANEDVNAIDFSSDGVSVEHKDRGHFIGLIPVNISVNVTVDQDGNVSVDYPWYSFLVTKDKADIESRVNAEIEEDVGASASGGWTNYDRARLAGDILLALRAHYEASASATATTTAGY